MLPREKLPIGTLLDFGGGEVYEITGPAIGYGGASILYPALRSGDSPAEGLRYVVKECYPASAFYLFRRSPTGEICPRQPSDRASRFLEEAKQRLLTEGSVSRQIYRSAARILPDRCSADRITLTLPGGQPALVSNAVTVMDSLEGKGQSLGAWLEEHGRFSAEASLRILHQILLAVREVHDAGFLHLDLQPGNIFLKGSLEESSELATLIDFGTARPLVADGRTAPVDPRTLCSTPGFSAPELTPSGTGSLRLGPETDVYALGRILLALLTGSLPDRHFLPHALGRTGCPRHLLPELEALVRRCLAPDPRDRYPGCAPLLQAVDGLLAGMRPRSGLQGMTYSAFLCYKHGPVDSAAALTLRDSLEKFRGPDGKRPFPRVFVDEGELSSCANFGEQIALALKNSAYLIVLCSEDTPGSRWVDREIETFLQTHGQDRSRILAVLTSGTPATSFPKALRGEDQVLAAPAQGQTLRQVRKRLRGDCLLRLAAPMLDLPYAALEQRQKVRTMKQALALTGCTAALALAFGGFAWNRAEAIRQQYRQAQINESLLLAEQASRLLADKDPLGAMELALAALPSGDNLRPALAEPEYVLGQALGIYRTPASAANTLTVTGILDTDRSRFFPDPSGQRLLAWDTGTQGIQVWNTETLTLERTLLENCSIRETGPKLLLPDGALLVLASDETGEDFLFCLDIGTGETLWTRAPGNAVTFCLSPDQDLLAVVSALDPDYFRPSNRDSAQWSLEVTLLDPASGAVLSGLPLALPGPCMLEDLALAPGGTCLAFTTWQREGLASERQTLSLLDLTTGEVREITDDSCTVRRMVFLTGGRLAVLRSQGYSTLTQDRLYVRPVQTLLELYTPTGERILSHSVQTQELADSVYQIHPVPYTMGDRAGEGLLYVFLDKCVLVDLDTGALLREFSFSSSVKDVHVWEDQINAVTADGSLHVYVYSLDTSLRLSCFQTVSAACHQGNVYYTQSAGDFGQDFRIRQYRFDVYDEGYTSLVKMEDTGWVLYGCTGLPEAPGILLTGWNAVCVVDAGGAQHRYALPEDAAFWYYSVLGVLGDKLYWGKAGNLHSLSLTDGSIRTLALPAADPEIAWTNEVVVSGDGLYLAATLSDGYTPAIFRWDPEADTLTLLARVPMSELWSFAYGSLYADETGVAFAATESRSGLYLAYVSETGKVTCFRAALPPSDTYPNWNETAYLWNAKHTQAFCVVNRQLCCVDRSGLRWYQPLESDAVDLCLSGDGDSLYLLCEDGVLRQYRTGTGEPVSSLDLNDLAQTTLSWPDALQWVDGSTLLVMADRTGFVLDCSTDTPKPKATVDNCVGYDSAGDCYLTATDPYASAPTEAGYFPRYSLEALVQKGNAMVHNGES